MTTHAMPRHDGGRIEAVVVGASAGAVDALQTLLAAIPRTFRAALLIVVHVPADNDTLLVDVLAPGCVLPVCEAADKEAIEPGFVYIAPAGYHLLVEPQRTLALSLEPPVNYSRPSIDVLFESAAYAYRDRLLGIVLTGANQDGADGLAIIRAAGGLAWVQDPSGAVASTMPASAIARAGADAIYDTSSMAQKLAALTFVHDR
jgi:two-component system, chemotaxis family, protein-glutamate methylesterase/glutaminase